jgi:hypothetical protein
MTDIKDGERCVVGLTKDGKFSVWHKVLGPGTPPKFVKGSELENTIRTMLVLYEVGKA